jgi:hypothetical protein
VALVLGACSSPRTASPGTVAGDVPAPVVSLPKQLLGLEIVAENVDAKLEGIRGSYLDGVGLYSFRQSDELLRATLQVGRFNAVAEPDEARFRNQVIAGLGSTVPEELRLGKERVYLTSGNEQNIFAWFDDEGFYVLSVRNDYPFPRTLLRRLVTADILK